MAIKEAFNPTIDGMTALASSSDLREMRALKNYLGTRTVNFRSREVHGQWVTFLCKENLTDIKEMLIDPFNKFTLSKELITCNNTLARWSQDTTSKCKPEITVIESYEEKYKFLIFFDLRKFILLL